MLGKSFEEFNLVQSIYFEKSSRVSWKYSATLDKRPKHLGKYFSLVVRIALNSNHFLSRPADSIGIAENGKVDCEVAAPCSTRRVPANRICGKCIRFVHST